jgi:acyl-CoA thioester hydrolase
MHETTPPAPPSGTFQGPLHLFPLRVYYEDTDVSGVVYHANYLRWFERARSDMLHLLGIEQGKAYEQGLGNYTVAELTIRYFAPARLDDAVTIATTALELRAASVRLRQRALKGDDLLADATVRVGFISPDGRPCRQPAAWRAAFDILRPAKDAA